MTKEENERRKSDKKVIELKEKICDRNSDKYYVFISYKSDDWEIVLTEIVYKLVNEYHLNIYYDGSFDKHNDLWVKQFPNNMDSRYCRGVLAFLDDKYATSYATLMELMHSQTNKARVDPNKKGLPIIPIKLSPLTYIDSDDDTGLGVKNFPTENGYETNPNAESEKKLFERDFKQVSSHDGIADDFIFGYNEDDETFRKKECSEMVKALIAFAKCNDNWYDKTEKFYEDLVDTIKNTCNTGIISVFSEESNTEKTDTVNKEETIITEHDENKHTETSSDVCVPSNDTPDKSASDKNQNIEKTDTVDKKAKSSIEPDKNKHNEDIKRNKKDTSSDVCVPPLPENSLKIGEFVYTAMRNLSKAGYVFSDKAIEEMTTPEWSNDKFHTVKPFMKVYIKGKTDTKGADGNVRFKAEPYTFGKHEVLISKEWYERQRNFFIDWYNSLKINCDGGGNKKSEGDITYTVYNKEYTDNQSNMMINVFAKVLIRHPEAVDKILEDSENPLLKCVSAVNYELPDNKNLPKLSYFKNGAYLDIGRGLFVGTGLSFQDKLRYIAMLLILCNEDFSILQSEQFELPKNVKIRITGHGDENYSVYGKKHNGNQTHMMIDVMRFLMEKHFDKKEALAGLLCIKLAPMDSLSDVTYFRAGEEFNYHGTVYSIGTSFSRNDKLKQIAKAIDICGEDIEQFEINGLSEIYSKSYGLHTPKGKRNFLYD